MTSFYRSTFWTEISMTSYQRSTFSREIWTGRQHGIYTYAFIYYNLSAVPKGVGVCDCLRVCPSSLPFPSSSTVTSMRFIILHIITYSEKRDSHIATLFIRPYAKRPYSMTKSITIVLPYCVLHVQHAVYQHFRYFVYEPKRVTSPLFR